MDSVDFLIVGGGVAGLRAAIGLADAGRVLVLTGDEFVVPGPRVVDATRKLARALHPDDFK